MCLFIFMQSYISIYSCYSEIGYCDTCPISHDSVYLARSPKTAKGAGKGKAKAGKGEKDLSAYRNLQHLLATTVPTNSAGRKEGSETKS